MKSLIFSLFDYGRELYNTYYIYKNNDFNEEDMKAIKEYIELIENVLNEMKENIYE